jgi:hypothetical protein
VFGLKMAVNCTAEGIVATIRLFSARTFLIYYVKYEVLPIAPAGRQTLGQRSTKWVKTALDCQHFIQTKVRTSVDMDMDMYMDIAIDMDMDMDMDMHW